MKIVAPAGNMERFYSAISATADEIYLGLKGFGARRNAENFTVEELKKAIDYAHLRGSRIFLTLNTIMTNREIELLYPTLKELYNLDVSNDMMKLTLVRSVYDTLDVYGYQLKDDGVGRDDMVDLYDKAGKLLDATYPTTTQLKDMKKDLESKKSKVSSKLHDVFTK